jgi:succinoglycan biosynthesis protein ExoO
VNDARFVLVPEPYYFYRSRRGSLVSGSSVERLNQECKAIVDFLQQDVVVEKNPDLVSVLYRKLALYQRNRVYYSVVEPLKQRAFLAALIQLVRNPYFFVQFLTEIKGILERRWQYYILGNKSAFHMLRPRN